MTLQILKVFLSAHTHRQYLLDILFVFFLRFFLIPLTSSNYQQKKIKKNVGIIIILHLHTEIL